jgi:recombinational DNA repair protein (RecF pathway)
LSYVRLWIFERENRDLLRLNSVELLESFFEMQREYRGQIAAHYVSEVCERLLPEREVNERVFRLLLAVFRGMKQGVNVERPLVYFNYWLLRLGGFLPDLERCAGCGTSLNDHQAFCRIDEGLICPSCLGRSGHDRQARPGLTREGSAAGSSEVFPSNGWHALSREALDLCRLCRTMQLEPWVSTAHSAQTYHQARLFLQELIQSNAEKPLVTRWLLDEVFNVDLAAGEGGQDESAKSPQS